MIWKVDVNSWQIRILPVNVQRSHYVSVFEIWNDRDNSSSPFKKPRQGIGGSPIQTLWEWRAAFRINSKLQLTSSNPLSTCQYIYMYNIPLYLYNHWTTQFYWFILSQWSTLFHCSIPKSIVNTFPSYFSGQFYPSG